MTPHELKDTRVQAELDKKRSLLAGSTEQRPLLISWIDPGNIIIRSRKEHLFTHSIRFEFFFSTTLSIARKSD